MSHCYTHFRGFCLTAALAAFVSAGAATTFAADGVSIAEKDGKLRVEINGQFFTEYHYQDVSRPFLYPVLGPSGVAMTRNWPMKTVPGEDHDHPHQKSLWWAHGAINGVDFWSETAKAGRTVHDKFLAVTSGPDTGVIKSLNKLVTKEGKVLGTLEFTLTFYSHKDGRTMDWETRVLADEGDLKFGDTKEGTMGMRLAESMRLQPNKENVGKPTGHIVNSEGVRDGATWGKRAKWVDYHGLVEGQLVGVAMFDNPANPRYPTWWHVRDYGLFAANPFGIREFDRNAKETGELTVPKGQSLDFKYRFYFHRGDEKEAKVADHYAEYLREGSK